MTEIDNPDSQTEPQSRARTIVRWTLVGTGVAAIAVVVMLQTVAPNRSRPAPLRVEAAPVTPLVEPPPLTFQPDIAPADAEAMNAMRRDYAGQIVAARPLFAPRTMARQPDLQRATECLTQAVYYEAASETAAGQRAVAQVVLNRVRDPNYPASVCGVIYQGSERQTGCQFTFTCDGALARKPDPFLYMRARLVAVAALSGQVETLVGLATHYHTRQVVPYWRTDLVKLRTVGAHIFYGWQGREKSARGLRTGYAGVEPMITPTAATTNDGMYITPTIDPLEGDVNAFGPPPATAAPLPGPRLPVRDYGQLRADADTGELKTRPTSPLEADNRAGALTRP